MTTARWLDDREQQVWRTYLSATARLSALLSAQLAAGEPGLTMGEYEVLVHLSEAPSGQARMSLLARDLVHSRSRLTHTASRMEARGLIERRSCPTDGRGVLAVLTDAGRQALVAAAPGHVAAVREHLFDALGAEQVDRLGEVVAALSAHLDAGPDAEGGWSRGDAAVAGPRSA